MRQHLTVSRRLIVIIVSISPAIFSFNFKSDYNKRAISITHQEASTTDTFPFKKRLQLFTEIDAKANEFWHSKKMKTINSLSTSTFSSLPLLVLTDRNGDRKAEEFSYLKNEKDQQSREFGFFFDINHDGKADYLVYNGGPIFTKDFSKMWWMNYHWIDSNGDGKIDICIYNTVHLSGDELFNEGISAWIYDNNYDGIFDTAEYLGKDFQKTIEKTGGQFIVKTSLGDEQWKEDEDMSFRNKILHDINQFK